MVTAEMHNWIIDHVLGTCDIGYVHRGNFNKEFGLDEGSDMFDEALEAAEIFLCEECGWYCEISHQSDIDGHICEDCDLSDEE